VRRWGRIGPFVVTLALAAAPLPPDATRLEALSPQRPLEYLELAEEIADAATTDAERQLARRLYALAGLLDRERLARSAALGLLAIETDRRQRERLDALARLLSPAVEAVPSRAFAVRRDAAVALSEAFSAFRRGRGSQGTSALRVPGADDLLDRYGLALPGGPQRFREDLRAFRAGSVRPEIAPEARAATFALDEALLSAAGDRPDLRFSSDLVRGGDAPLPEVDALRLESVFGTDLSRPIWRDGQWVPPPAAP